MPDRTPQAPNALISSIGEKLNLNPLVLSLFAISPADALEHIGIHQGGWIEVRRATDAADRAQVADILAALHAGRSTLENARQVIAAPPMEPLSAPSLSLAPPTRMRTPPAPDLTLIVARTTLQFVLERYARHQFTGKPYQLTPQPWLDVTVIGTSLGLALAEGCARIVARLDATFACKLQVFGRRVPLFTRRSPIAIDLSAMFSVNAAGQLCVGVGPGSIRVPDLPLPASLITMLYEQLRRTVSAIPVAYFPTHLDLPEASAVLADDVQMQISNVAITEQAVMLEFQLFFGPNASLPASSSAGAPNTLLRER